jgi:hypothetical protein
VNHAYVLDSFVGRTAVFIENSYACLAIVQTVKSDSEHVHATFGLVPDSFRCRLRFIRQQADDPIEERLDAWPYGGSWNVMVSNKEFYLGDDHWQASFLWGGGFRVFFQPTFVQRFAAGDVSWLDEYYGEGEDGDAGHNDGGS